MEIQDKQIVGFVVKRTSEVFSQIGDKSMRTETKRLEAVYQQKLLNLEDLKKNILQKAFAEELRGGEPVEP